MNIPAMLDTLSEYEAQRDAIALRKAEAIAAVLTDEIKAKLDEIYAEFDPLYPPVDEQIDQLTAAIKLAVIENGASVKGQYRHAVLTPEKITPVYDAKALDGYAVDHPEIKQFRSEDTSKPSVAIRKVK